MFKGKIEKFLVATLSTNVTPLAYLVLLHNMIFAGAFIFFRNAETTKLTVLSQLGILGGLSFWAFMLFGAAAWLILALHLRSKFLLNISSMIGWGCWLAAVLTYVVGSAWLQAATAVTFTMMYGYFFTAGNLGRLWNYSPERD